MRPFRLDRRSVLRGAGSVAIALPWLEAMQPVRPVQAQQAAAKRFVAVYTPGGTVIEDFVPTGTKEDFSLSSILLPLEPVKNRLVVLQGLDMKCAVGEQHQSGMIGWLTGSKQDHSPTDVIGPSLDRVLAELLGTEVLYQAIRWGTSPYLPVPGTPHPVSSVSYAVDGSNFVPQAPELDPTQIWQKLFGAVVPDKSVDWRKSILDSVLSRYERLHARLGARDRQLLEQHMQHLRDLEQAVSMQCMPPPEPTDTGGYNPRAFSAADPVTDAAIPEVGKLLMDLLVTAMACDLVHVSTLQWADSHAGYTLPWLELTGNQVQNYYENNGGYHPDQMTRIYNWYSSQHAYLLGAMANVDMGGHSLLDESVVFFGSQQRGPNDHSKDDMPFLLAGGGGGLMGNRYRDYGGRSHNDLLSAILNLFGDTRTSFGDPTFCTQPLDDLLT